MSLTATLNSSLASLHSRLVAAIGLPEALASTLSQKALPVMVRTICKADSLGSAEHVWATCQQFYQAQAHTNLTELTRSDGGWPEHRRHLAQALLVPNLLSTLTEHCAPATAGQAGEWLGCLALVTFAAAGQCAAENQLDAAGLQSWLRRQPIGLREPLAEVAGMPILAAARPSRAAANSATAPWWPLAVLAVVGISAGSYFWQQQTAATAPQPRQAATALTAARPPAPVLSRVVAAPAEATTPAKPAAPGAPGSTASALSAASAKRAAGHGKQPDKLAAVPALELVKNVAGAGRPQRLDYPSAARVAPLAIRRLSKGKNLVSHERSRLLPTMLFLRDSASIEAVLYTRLTNPESSSRKPIDLDHISFAHGRATLDPEGTKQLSSIASVLKMFPHYRLIVLGNAESSEPNSIVLALERANAVVAELVRQGVPSAALQAQSHMRSAADKTDDATARRRPALYISSL